MINLNKTRIAIYFYLLIVFTIIFGLSFSVQGDKITGSFILETAGNFISNLNLLYFNLVLFVFLISLALTFLITRYVQEEKNLSRKKVKFFAGFVVVLLAASFLSFGVYFNNNEITGAAVGMERVTGMAETSEINNLEPYPTNFKDDTTKSQWFNDNEGRVWRQDGNVYAIAKSTSKDIQLSKDKAVLLAKSNIVKKVYNVQNFNDVNLVYDLVQSHIVNDGDQYVTYQLISVPEKSLPQSVNEIPAIDQSPALPEASAQPAAGSQSTTQKAIAPSSVKFKYYGGEKHDWYWDSPDNIQAKLEGGTLRVEYNFFNILNGKKNVIWIDEKSGEKINLGNFERSGEFTPTDEGTTFLAGREDVNTLIKKNGGDILDALKEEKDVDIAYTAASKPGTLATAQPAAGGLPSSPATVNVGSLIFKFTEGEGLERDGFIFTTDTGEIKITKDFILDTSTVLYKGYRVGYLDGKGTFHLDDTDEAIEFEALESDIIVQLQNGLTVEKIDAALAEGTKQAEASQPATQKPKTSFLDYFNPYDIFNPAIEHTKIKIGDKEQNVRVDKSTGIVTKENGNEISGNGRLEALDQVGDYFVEGEIGGNIVMIDPNTRTAYGTTKETKSVLGIEIKEYKIKPFDKIKDKNSITLILIEKGKINVVKDKDGVQYLKYYEEGKIVYEKANVEAGKIIGGTESYADREKFDELHKEDYARNIIDQNARQLFSNLVNLLIGETVSEQIQELCKEEEQYSDGPAPYQYNSGPQSTSNILGEDPGVCSNSELTTITAQAQRTTIEGGFTFDTSWTITPCKEDVQYLVYLANDINDRISITSGTATKEEINSESKQFSYTKDYNQICVQVSDLTIGINGYSCFNVV